MGEGTANIIFDRTDSAFATALSARLTDWATVHTCLDSAALGVEMEDADGKIVVIFDIPVIDERFFTEPHSAASVTDFETRTNAMRETFEDFMEKCQAVVKVGSLKSDAIQVWCLAQDDVACRQLNLPETPIQTQARVSCFKSLSKEYGRMGIYFNTCVYHPEKSALPKETLKTLKQSMKPYALRYKAPDAADLSAVLESMIRVDNPVMNGGCLTLANGSMECGS